MASSSLLLPENSSQFKSPGPSSSALNFQHPAPAIPSHNSNSEQRDYNVFQLLVRREVSPRSKYCQRKRFSRDTAKDYPDYRGLKRDAKLLDSRGLKCDTEFLDSRGLKNDAQIDPRRGLVSWVEAESLLHLSARYCPLLPPPRSTIAAAFSSDGKLLASTHGDHTVKIIDSQTSKCLKVLSGHRRTPWVVRFHPLHPELLASGSLDFEVRLWNAKSGECIASRDFYRPIASIAFHAEGEFLAVASGHKLYIWHYNKTGEASNPKIILKTRRSLRAVNVHPYAAPLLLTAEVNELDSSDSSMTVATSAGYLHYPPPTMFLADGRSTSRFSQLNEFPFPSPPSFVRSSISRDDDRIPSHLSGLVGSGQGDLSPSERFNEPTNPSGQFELVPAPMESDDSRIPEVQQTSSTGRDTEGTVSRHLVNAMDVDERMNYFPPPNTAYWELPFLQGWLMGQSQASLRALHLQNSGSTGSIPPSYMENSLLISSVVSQSATTNTRVAGGNGSQTQFSHQHMRSFGPGIGNVAAINNVVHNNLSNPQAIMNLFRPEVPASLAGAVAAAELPCTVKLRLWSHDLEDPCSPLDAERCRLTIPHAVLCSEMGTHFSPCGRFLAACVACVLPTSEVDPGFSGQVLHGAAEAGTSPTRHPISAHKVIYELRVYSLEESSFGSVLASRAIRAAHCLTSIQFSPTSEHLLLAYGRRHGSLLKSVVIDGDMTVPIYTILEVYRVSDMELVRVLPCAEDEVNVACFHPEAGRGLVYGTKEGKLRFLQHVSRELRDDNASSSFTYSNMI